MFVLIKNTWQFEYNFFISELKNSGFSSMFFLFVLDLNLVPKLISSNELLLISSLLSESKMTELLFLMIFTCL